MVHFPLRCRHWFRSAVQLACRPKSVWQPLMLQRVAGYEKSDLYKSRPGGVWDAYFHVEGVKQLLEAVRDEATIIQPLRRQPYGNWEFEVRDPNGYVLVFSERS